MGVYEGWGAGCMRGGGVGVCGVGVCGAGG